MASVPTVEFSTQAQVTWRAFRSKEPGYWVAVCDSLNLSAQAQSWQELFATCDEIVQELLLDLYEDGQLDAFLRDRGWVPLTPAPKSAAKLKFDIPIALAPESTPDADPNRAAH